MGLSNSDKFRNYNRKVRRADAFAGESCVVCGEDDPAVLERHHVAGRAVDEDMLVVVCANDHRKATAYQMDFKTDLSHDDARDFLNTLGAWLRSIAAFLKVLLDAFLEMASKVDEFGAYLDDHVPAWRG